jgi:hypothetical protein
MLSCMRTTEVRGIGSRPDGAYRGAHGSGNGILAPAREGELCYVSERL